MLIFRLKVAREDVSDELKKTETEELFSFIDSIQGTSRGLNHENANKIFGDSSGEQKDG